MGTIRQSNWCATYRRGFDVAAVTAFAGPAVGGAVFGLMMWVNQIILAVQQGQFPGPPVTLLGDLFVLLFLPMTTALMAFVHPPVWVATVIAALYVGSRVGVTGRMTWAETVLLAVICVAAAANVYPIHSPEIVRFFLMPAICSALTLRYLAGRLGYIH